MNKTIQHLVKALLFMWELPQTLLGLMVYAILKNKHRIVRIEKEKHRLYLETINTGVSLGLFIFWTPAGNRFWYLKNDCRMHEFGHARQSVRLGPLYLLIVGIPSLSRVFYRWLYRKFMGRNWQKYYFGFPENWADGLGGVRDPKRCDICEEFL